MKLISLEFEGVGAFAGRTEIDFEALAGSGLFLIEGPTGSGKSTILDAIVFALYGSPAGSQSDLGRLDSQLRLRSASPYVELTFEVNGCRYRIRRTPRHQRDKVRGEGATDDAGSVSLMQVAPEMRDLGHKAREVGDWIIENVGLTKSQFASTIVLAQGEFASFLDADTSSRAQILERVFGTEFYKQVEDQLAIMRRGALSRRAKASEALRGAIDRCLGALGLEPGELEVQRIGDEVQALEREVTSSRQRSDEAAAALIVAEEQLLAANSLREAQQRKRELICQAEELAQTSHQVQRKRQALQESQRALPIATLHEQACDAQEQVDAVQRELQGLQERLQAHGVVDASEGSLSDVDRLLGELLAAASAEQELPGLQQRADLCGRAHQSAVSRLQELRLERDRVKSQAADARVRLETLTDPTAALTQAHLDVERAEREVTVHDQVSALQRDLQDAQTRLQAAEQDWETSVQVLAVARGRVARDQAALLAEHLVEGQPCLVCGATEHPSPAADCDEPPADLAAAEQAAGTCADVVAAHRDSIQRLEAQIEVLGGSSSGGEEATRALVAAEARLARCQLALEQMAAARDCAAQLTDQCEALGEAVERANLQVQKAHEELGVARQDSDAARVLVEAGRGDFPTVRAHREALQSRADLIRAYLSVKAREQTCQAAVIQAEKALRQTVEASGFADVDVALARVLSDADRCVFETQVHDFDRAQAAVSAGLAGVSDIDLSITVDVAALREQRDLLADASQRLAEHHGTVLHRLSKALPLQRDVHAAASEVESVWQSTEAVVRMADYATANRSEVVHKVRLSSFVLMRRFQAVVDAANDRLDAISDGRYQLAAHTTGLDQRSQAGLDLVVTDQHTEQNRSTRSLSGGERFYVALALALGLADVVRSESGGVQLGTLFIDEGFGSLDERTLDEVMDMLEQVRSGQDRVIGLVSHVPLLKERIDPRISVRRDPQRPGVSTLEVRV